MIARLVRVVFEAAIRMLPVKSLGAVTLRDGHFQAILLPPVRFTQFEDSPYLQWRLSALGQESMLRWFHRNFSFWEARVVRGHMVHDLQHSIVVGHDAGS
jgi:hypothetical protein